MGRYLMQLWEAKPRNFRSLARPRWLADLPEPPAPTVTIVSPHELEEPLFVDKRNPRTPLLGASALADSSSEMSSAMSPHTATTSTIQVEAELSMDKEEASAEPEPEDPYHQISKFGSNGRFTSNEWALACYGVDLGGPVWNFDNMDLEEDRTPELEPLDDLPEESGSGSTGWGCTIC